MPITPESLVRHELVGLPVAVTAAANPDLLSVAGEVVMETTKTLGIEADADATDADGAAAGGRVYHVPKEGATFTFELPREAPRASDASGERSDPRAGDEVTVEGRRLVGRPARRTENTGDSKWR